MDINNYELKLEKENLNYVLKEITNQMKEKSDMMGNFRNGIAAENKNMWEESSHAPSSLIEIVQNMQFVNELKVKTRNYDFYKKVYEKLEKMYNSAYFGRIDFKEDGEEQVEKIYIGISGLTTEEYDFLVYDWRAPISNMFYDFEIGRSSYNCPKCNVEGYISLKRQYRIFKDNIEYMFDSSLKIDDEILQQILSKNADDKMRNIVTTIQREQNKAIRDDSYKYLIVQGPAGSGKTSIALHRIAYLLYKYRDKITSDNIMIFSPNEIFNDYISNVLPELGEENIKQITFKDFMDKTLKIDLKTEDLYDEIEYLMGGRSEKNYGARVESIKYKTSKEFINTLKDYATCIEKNDIEFEDIIYRNNIIVTKEELSELLYKDYINLPLVKRLLKIKDRIYYLLEDHRKRRVEEIKEVLKDNPEYFSDNAIKVEAIRIEKEEFQCTNEIIERITSIDILRIYKKLFNKDDLHIKDFYGCNLREMMDITLENIECGNLFYEDCIGLMYLKFLFGEIEQNTEIKHVVIDEAQDYTKMQLELLKNLFPNSSFTILGDKNQRINYYFNGLNSEEFKEVFSSDQCGVMSLSKSYRSTKEITEFSRSILKGIDFGDYVDRKGEKPSILRLNKNNFISKLLDHINRYKEKGFKTIGIICKDRNESLRLYKLLRKHMDIKLIQKDDEKYDIGSVILPIYLAKGLEFDGVLVMNVDKNNYSLEEERQLLYVACTRALHELSLFYFEEPSNLIEGC